MSHALRLTRIPLRRLARLPGGHQYRTFLAPTAARKADLVQDLYLKELKNYKPTPPKPSDATEHVHVFSAPKPPPSPENISLADDLKTYENQRVEIEGNTEEGEEDVDEASKFFEELDEHIEESTDGKDIPSHH